MCSARAVPSRGAHPQRSIVKSPRLKPPSCTKFYMGRTLNLDNNWNRSLAPLAGAGGVKTFSNQRGVHVQSTQHGAAAAVLFVQHRHGIEGVSTDERHSSSGPATLALTLPRHSQASSNQLGANYRDLPRQPGVGAAAGAMAPHTVLEEFMTDGSASSESMPAPKRKPKPPSLRRVAHPCLRIKRDYLIKMIRASSRNLFGIYNTFSCRNALPNFQKFVEGGKAGEGPSPAHAHLGSTAEAKRRSLTR